MYVKLSQYRYSSSITPSFQCPTVHISILNGFPVGGSVFPFPIGIGFVKVPSMTPITLVQSPAPNLTGWVWIRVSGAWTKIAFRSSMCCSMPFV